MGTRPKDEKSDERVMVARHNAVVAKILIMKERNREVGAWVIETRAEARKAKMDCMHGLDICTWGTHKVKDQFKEQSLNSRDQ